jgi:DNA-binding SARP family transcriptional activator
MEFRMLGPLDVERGDRSLRLGARRERTVLARLLLQPNVAVAVDALVDALWPTSPPASAVHAVHVAVSRLRQLLDDDEAPRIQTRRPGYALRVEPGELDVDTFERLAAAGEQRWRQGDAAGAARLLGEGLGLWRGAVLADLADEPFVEPVAARLTEARLAALELRIEANLALGRGGSLIGELEDLCAAHPLRELLRGQLMRAMAEVGRQSDALRVYRDTRALLVEELGVEPSPALQAVHRQVLAGSLGPNTPPPVATGRPGAEVRLHDERKVVTVLYVDWRPGAALLADPERLRRSNREFSALVSDSVARTGGRVEESIGTAALASFGATVAVEDHAQRALRAALDIRRRALGRLTEDSWLRIGVSSGEVVVGADRAQRRTISGEAVVGAAQLEQAGEPGEIRVGDRTWRLARGQFVFSDLSSTEPVGANDASRSVRLLQDEAEPSDDLLGRPRTFIGREEELRLIQSVFERTRETRRPHVLTVGGEAGVGKTSLVREFAHRVGNDDPAAIIRTGRCLAYGRGITYWPLAEILRAQLGLPLSADAATVLARLDGAEVLGLTLGLDVVPDLHPLAAQQRLYGAWVDLAEQMGAAGSPVIWVIEDVHWAEPPLLDLLDQLVLDTRAGLLVICTGRPEMAGLRPGGVGGSRGSTLWLEPLDSEEAQRLAVTVLGSQPPVDLLPMLRRAEGNPFFLEELLASLIDAGVLVQDGAAWSISGSLADAAVPDTVRGVLAARFDLMPADDRAGLQAAAVAGREFSVNAVSHMVEGITPDYRRLTEREFLVRAPTPRSPDERYMFKHALTREVVYNGLGREDRADLHGSFAEWLQARRNSEEFAPLLAHHYEQAVQPLELVAQDAARAERNDVVRRKAVEWLKRAGEQAIGRHAIDEGLALLHRALELEPEPEEQSRLWHAVGRGHAVRYDGMACWRALERAVALTDDPAERADIYSELALQTVTRYAMLNPMPARELVDQWVAEALDQAPDASLARARALAANAMWFADDPSKAAGDAYAAAVEVGDVEVLDHAYNAQALAAFTEGRYEDAQGWAARRLGLLDSISDPDVVVDIYSAMIPGLLGAGDFAGAYEYAARHDEAASRLSAHHRVHAVAMQLEVHELTASWSNMSALADRTRAAVLANEATPCARNARSLLAVALGHALCGDAAAAGNFEARAADVSMAGYEASVAALRIMLALHRDQLDEVERLLPVAVPPPPARNWWRLVTLATRLDALAQLGWAEQAAAEASPLTRPGTYLAPFAERCLALVDKDPARLVESARQFRALGLTWHAEQTERAGRTGRLAW